MANTIHTWYVVTNSEGTILAVYGSALLSEAQATCRKIERQTGMFAYLHSFAGNRPSVYGSISMKGASVVSY